MRVSRWFNLTDTHMGSMYSLPTSLCRSVRPETQLTFAVMSSLAAARAGVSGPAPSPPSPLGKLAGMPG